MLKIGEFSKMAKITVSALRYYEKMGLLQPMFTNKDSSYRYYSEEQLADIQKIIELREIGLSIREIHAVLCGSPLEPLLKQRKIEIERELSVLYGQQEKLAALMRFSDTENQYSAVIRDIPGYIVFSCTGIIRNIDVIRDFIPSCHREFRRLNPDIPYTKEDYCCIIYPEESYRDMNSRIEYVQSVERPGTESDFLKFKTLPGCRVVTIEHRGSYHDLRCAYSFAVRWAQEHELQVCGAPRERYIFGSWNRKREDDWLTEIQIPVSESRVKSKES